MAKTNSNKNENKLSIRLPEGLKSNVRNKIGKNKDIYGYENITDLIKDLLTDWLQRG